MSPQVRNFLFLAALVAGCGSNSAHAPDLASASDLGEDQDLGGGDASPAQHTLTVTVDKVGGASGGVTSAPSPEPAIDCGSACTGTYNVGASILLSASPAPGFYFGGWGGDCATSAFALGCTVKMNADKQVTATFTPANQAFVTVSPSPLAVLAARGTGATMTDQVLSGADATCATEATQNGLTGHFVAWLSSNESLAPARLKAANAAMQMPRGWLRSDGKPFVDQIDIQDPHIFYPLGLVSPPPTGSPFAWTGTDVFTAAQAKFSPSCNDWTSVDVGAVGAVGHIQAGAGAWSSGNDATCDQSAHLYCLQVEYQAFVPEPSPQPQQKWAFVTDGTFDPSKGLTAADALCDSEARAAHLATTSGQFTALLAPTGMTAASRFSPGGTLPYVRTDNVAVVATDSDLFVSPAPVLAPIDRTATGKHAPLAFLGALSPTALADQNCNGWTDGTASVDIVEPSLELGGFVRACSAPEGLVCLQK